jgi:cytochrome b561
MTFDPLVLPDGISPAQFAILARILHWLMAALLLAMLLIGASFALPLVGWAMLSAGRYPIIMFGAVHLPPIPLFLTFLAHLGAVLFHTLVLRNGLLSRMAPWSFRQDESEARG